MTLIPKTCFFTGHRFLPASEMEMIKSRLNEELLNAVNCGFTHFIAGGAMGFDTVAAEQVISLRGDYTGIRLVLYLPCRNHTQNWGENERVRFDRIKELADEIYYVTREDYREGCMKKRNSAMAEASDMCIAYLKNPMSGTAQAVKLAEKKGLKIINIADCEYILQ